MKVGIQGERELVEHNHKLGELILKIFPTPAGLPKIEIQFLINPDGILKVKAKELRTQTEKILKSNLQLIYQKNKWHSRTIYSIKNAQTDLDKEH